MERLAYSIDEAAEALGIGRTLMYELVGAGEIRTVKVRTRRLVRRDELERLLGGPFRQVLSEPPNPAVSPNPPPSAPASDLQRKGSANRGDLRALLLAAIDALGVGQEAISAVRAHPDGSIEISLR